MIRSGEWRGEAIAYGSLFYPEVHWLGGIRALFALDVDDLGTVGGWWNIDGEALVYVDGDVPVLFRQTHTGLGMFSDRGQTDEQAPSSSLVMTGGVGSRGTAETEFGSIDVGPVQNPFQSDVRILHADCYELVGDWIDPLEMLAGNEGWFLGDLNGLFRASFVGDDPEPALIERIDQLNADTQAWADEMVATGVFDLAATFALLVRAREIAVALAEADMCEDGPTPDPSTYISSFTYGLMLGMVVTLQSHEMSGSSLFAMVTALGALGNSGAQAMVGSEIQKQTQRIVGSSASAYGDGCSPCVDPESGTEVIEAAAAGDRLGQEFEIDGEVFTGDQVIDAAIK
ncbi:MAG: hypothetical protein ABFR95_00365 [Actinomycetota bacterium]